MKLLNRPLLLVIIVFIPVIVAGQERFNLRENLEQNAVVFKGVIELEDGRFGVSGSTVNPTDSGIFQSMSYSMYSFDGNHLSSTYFNKDEGYFLPLSKSGLVNLNSDLYQSCVGYEVNFDSVRKGFLVTFTDVGDTLGIIKFNSPYLEEFENAFIAPVGMCKSVNSDNSIFISSNILNPQPGESAGDFYIQRMKPSGEVLWEYIYATDAEPESCNALLPTSGGGVLGVLREPDVSTKYIELDDSGNLVNLVSNDLINTVNDLVWSTQSDQFIGAGAAQGTDGYLTGRIFKMNTNGEVIWDTIMGAGYESFFANQLYKIVKPTDDSGYVAGGRKLEYIPEAEVTEQSGNGLNQGWLVKIDEDGTVLWERKYHFIDTPVETHTINDLKATSDGGYIFCGESTDEDWQSGYAYSEGPRQQGWLVKVDGFGCLVEGCEQWDGINVIEQDSNIQYFKAGPNPANQFLNIYQAQNASYSATYELYDLQGKRLESFPVMSKGTTLMLDVSKYPSGNYVLSLISEGQLLQQQKVIFN